MRPRLEEHPPRRPLGLERLEPRLLLSGLTADQGTALQLFEVPVDSGGAIADLSTTNLTFTMAQSGPVVDVNLQLAMDHTYITDLTVTLVSPSDQGNPPVSVELFHWLSPDNEDAEFQDAVFDDDNVEFQQGPIGSPGNLEPPYQYVYQPQYFERQEQKLSVFDGIEAKGTWTLVIIDDEEGDAGQLYAPGDSVPWGAAGTAIGTKLIVTIAVDPVNDAPQASGASLTTDEDIPAEIDLRTLVEDVETPDDDLVFAVEGAVNGTVQLLSGHMARFTPAEDYSGPASFSYTVTDTGDNGADAISVGPVSIAVTVNNLVDFAGRVFEDRDNDGVYDPVDGDTGLAGVTVQLLDQTTDALIDTQATDEQGEYRFDANLHAGTYKVVEIPPDGYLDGKETAGSIGGAVDNTQDSNEILDILVGAPGTTADGVGYDFADLLPASVQGLVWEDRSDDGEVDLVELAVAGAVITLTGTDDRGPIDPVAQDTNAQGIFQFVGLRPGEYQITETQPEGFIDGQDVVGEVVETEPPAPPTVLGDDGYADPAGDRFSGIRLVAGAVGVNYNFGERTDEGHVHEGQTAKIGYWKNKHGQSLIKSLNGSEDSTILGNWLAETFPNMYGFLAGLTNVDIAAAYRDLFKRNGKNSPGGPPKLDAKVLAVALATFVTRESLVLLRYDPAAPANPTLDPSLIAGVESHGFVVTAGGLGSAFFNIGDSGEAFDGYGDWEEVQVIDLLLATDRMSLDGLLYDDADTNGEGDGTIDDFEAFLRTLANEVYAALNEQGEI